MRLYLSALVLGLFLLFPALAARAEDKLFLHNGDTLSGTITHYSPKTITIETGYGQFDIPLSYIEGAFAARDSQAQDIRQILAQGQGGLNPAKTTPQAVSATTAAVEGKAPTLTASSESVDSRALWGADWSGRVDFGFDVKTGNADSSGIDADGVLKADWDKHKTAVALSYSREEEDGDLSVNKSSIKLSDDYFYSEKWFIGSSAKFEQDEIERLDLRSVLTSGLGYQPYKRDDLNLKFIMGPGYLYEEFDDGRNDHVTVANWQMAYDQKFLEDSFRLFHKHEVSAPADDFSAYLFESVSGIRVPIAKGIIASAQIDFDWDNDPAQNTVEDDTSYSIRLGYEWLHKK